MQAGSRGLTNDLVKQRDDRKELRVACLLKVTPNNLRDDLYSVHFHSDAITYLNFLDWYSLIDQRRFSPWQMSTTA
jgi:hypothetical protein